MGLDHVSRDTARLLTQSRLERVDGLDEVQSRDDLALSDPESSSAHP
jgi:hypothetical protein